MTTRTTLVSGADAATREAAIRRSIDSENAPSTAVILEGLAYGNDAFEFSANRPNIHIIRIASGCLCCTGNLTLGVHLNRILRQRPAQLYISLADATHIERLEEFLKQPAYAKWLTLAGQMSYATVR